MTGAHGRPYETFLEEANPELPPDPENKKEIEHMTPENKHLILETDSAILIDLHSSMDEHAQRRLATEDFGKRPLPRRK